MNTITENRSDPKISPDSFSGVETDNQVTNSEEQNVVNDDIVDKSDETEKHSSENETAMTEKEKIDISGTN